VVFGKTAPSSSPIQIGEGGAGRPWPGGGWRPPGPTAAGGRGKRSRRARPSHPRAHLWLGRREEMDRRRRTERGGGARGGGAVELGKTCGCSIAVCCGEGGWCWPFYRRPKAVPGRKYLAGDLYTGSGSGGSRRQLWAGRARSPGDGTARAEAEVVVQASGLFNPMAQER
jgi:hypothetical protein